MTKVGVSLLGGDYSALGNQIKKLEKAGADIISFDVMDGHFVKNITVGPDVIKSCRHVTKLPFECHLMIAEPERYVGQFIDAGCDIVTVHVESTKKLDGIIKTVKGKSRKMSVALKPDTHAKAVFPYLKDIDMVLVMTVDPGFASQRFMDMSEKIKALKSEIKGRGLSTKIMVDGGINNETSRVAKAAGADILISASYILNNDYKTAIKNLRRA
ncbi:MAG: ribulose-phosphate 3-epimerase [Candidatus Aenigmarchaeota archaeon]|nr:ribulose-phosphate 3-epimerase [Candidatus Aenigmarchaeota archaeon]